MSLILVPGVSTDRQGGAAETANPRFLVDVAVSKRWKTGALVTSELALSGDTYANTAACPVRLSTLPGRTGPAV